MSYYKNTVKAGIIVNTYKGGFTLETSEGFYEVELENKDEAPKTCKAVKVLGNSFKPGVIFEAVLEYLEPEKPVQKKKHPLKASYPGLSAPPSPVKRGR